MNRIANSFGAVARGAFSPRILMTADTVGGVWTYAVELARALQADGVEVALATMGRLPDESQRREVAALTNVTLFASEYALEWMDDPWREVDRAGEWLRDVAEEFCPDIIHLNGYTHASLGWSAPVLVAAHSCVLSWWRAVRKKPAPVRYDEYRRRVEAGLAAADLVVAPTAAMLDSLRENYAASTAGLVIANGRDPHSFQPTGKEAVIFSSGRFWDEAKNIAALDAVAERLDWPLEVAGECNHPERTERLTSGLKPLGPLGADEVARKLSRASIFALPARYEPFGLSVLEAALAECALVVGDISSLRETWADAALYVDPEDHDELAATLGDLIAQPEWRRALGRRARARGLQFSPEKMASAYLAAYRDLLRVAPSVAGRAPVAGTTFSPLTVNAAPLHAGAAATIL